MRPWALVPLVALLTLYWFFLFSQPLYNGDETIYVTTSQQLMQGKTEPLLDAGHPPLGIFLIALSLRVFDYPRIIGGILASITFVLLYSHLKAIKGIATGTFILLMVNPLFVQVMGLAMLEAFWVSFSILAFLAISKAERNWIMISGLLFGCALASKWTAFPFIIGAVIYLITTNRSRTRYLPFFFLLVAFVYVATNVIAISSLGWSGFVSYQLNMIGSHEIGGGAVVIHSTHFREMVAPLMTFLGFTNALYLAPYVPHLFAFNTYWYLTYAVNPGLWVITIPFVAVSVYRLIKRPNNLDFLWLLFFAAGLSVIYLTPKFFTYYFDGLAFPQAYLIASSVPTKLRTPLYVFAALLPVLLFFGPHSH